MNDLIFRGKSKDGSWNYGNLVHLCCEVRGLTTKEAWEIRPVKINGPELPVLVDPLTVSQSTGLSDCNRIEIYEGDILEARYDEDHPENITRTEVIWDRFRYQLRDVHTGAYDDLDGFSLLHNLVVGNIWDNPELLDTESQN